MKKLMLVLLLTRRLNTMYLVAGLILFLPAGVLSDHFGSPHLTAPYSGKKCVEYDLELSVSRENKKQFRIPEDCPDLLLHSANNRTWWNSILEKKLWDKAERDCHFVNFLHQHPDTVKNDFVTDFDFLNAPISVFPTSMNCGMVKDEAICNQMSVTIPMLMTMLFPDTLKDSNTVVDWGQCHLSKGVFRGRLDINDDNDITCQIDPTANGIRIIGIDYANLNGDEFLDAVLRIVRVGKKSKRKVILFPLTRFSQDGPFLIPPDINVPSVLQQ